MFGKPQMISNTDDPHRRRQSSNAADVFRRSFFFAISVECFHGCLLGYWSSGSIAPGRFLARGLVRRPETGRLSLLRAASFPERAGTPVTDLPLSLGTLARTTSRI